jgi:hypothetical protein
LVTVCSILSACGGPAAVAPTAAEKTACTDINLVDGSAFEHLTKAEQSTRGHQMITAAEASGNSSIVSAATTLQSDANANNSNGTATQLINMEQTCRSLGIGLKTSNS